MAQIHHIVFNDNVDGIVSAAIYLHNCVRGSTYRLYPISFSLPTSSLGRGDKFKLMIKEMNLKKDKDLLIILSCESNIRGDLWVDHHWTQAMGDQRVENAKVIYDPHSKSTARLAQSIAPKKAVSKYPDAFLNMLEIISGTDYKSPYQIFNDVHPLMILRAYIERSIPSEMMICRIVEMISKTHFDFKKTTYQLKLGKEVINSLRKDTEKTKKHIVVYGNFSVIKQRRVNQHPKYAEFFIRPETKYSVRLSTTGSERLFLQVGYNKWHKEQNEVNIGRMLSSLSYMIRGGGHHGLGGGMLYEKDEEQLLNDLSININKENVVEEEMEKVGVDKENDPIEAKAEEMVKTGESKNISEAREFVSAEENKKETKTENSQQDSKPNDDKKCD